MVEFLAALHVQRVDLGFPLRRGLLLVRVPQVQRLAAVPHADAAVRLGAAGESDDHRLPVVRRGQLPHELPELDRLELRVDADEVESLVDDRGHPRPHVVVDVRHELERDRVAGSVLAHPVAVAVRPAEAVEDRVGALDVVLVAAHVGVVEVAGGGADRRPLRVAEPVLDLGDDPLLVDAVRHGAAELDVGEPRQLLGGDVGVAALRVRAGVEVEAEEHGAEGRTAPVDGEVACLLLRLEGGVVLAAQSVRIHLAGLELRQLIVDGRDEQLHDALDVGERIAAAVPQPVVGVALEHHALLRHVARDGERARTDDLGGIAVHAPEVVERPRLDVRFEDVPRVDRRAHRTQERRERRRQHELHRVVVDGGHGHRRLLPGAGVVEVAELEGGAVAGGDVVVVDDAVEREVDIACGEWLAVVPTHALAEVEGPRQAVVRVLPGLGQRRLDLVGEPRHLGQSLEQVAEEPRGVGVVREREVERQRLADGGRRHRPARVADVVLEGVGARAQSLDDRLLSSRGGGRRGCGVGRVGSPARAVRVARARGDDERGERREERA